MPENRGGAALWSLLLMSWIHRTVRVHAVLFSITSSSAIAERPRCRVGSHGQKWKIDGHYRSISKHCDNWIRWKNTKYVLLRRSRSSRSVSIESPYATSY